MATDDSGDYDFENYSTSSLDELESRVEELEAKLDEAGGGRNATGLSFGYALGMCIAVVLSWSRNASILWCICHGICSWFYVLYVAIADR